MSINTQLFKMDLQKAVTFLYTSACVSAKFSLFAPACTMARYLLPSLALLASPAASALFPDCVNGPLSNNTVCDTSASVSDRARAFVNELTTAEKFNLTGNESPGVPRLGIYP